MTRVKSAILVSAALRCADKEMIDCVLVHRGDADAGAIFLHIDARDGRHQILARSLGFDGVYAWQVTQVPRGWMQTPPRPDWTVNWPKIQMRLLLKSAILRRVIRF